MFFVQFWKILMQKWKNKQSDYCRGWQMKVSLGINIFFVFSKYYLLILFYMVVHDLMCDKDFKKDFCIICKTSENLHNFLFFQFFITFVHQFPRVLAQIACIVFASQSCENMQKHGKRRIWSAFGVCRTNAGWNIQHPLFHLICK